MKTDTIKDVKDIMDATMTSWTSGAKQLYVEEIGRCFTNLNTYGTSSNDFKVIAKSLLNDLNHLPANKVIDAIRQWRRTNEDFPKPCNIIQIVEPKPIMDRAVYVALCEKKKRGNFLSSKEAKYITEYQRRAIEGA